MLNEIWIKYKLKVVWFNWNKNDRAGTIIQKIFLSILIK